jgi:hypothetical protein
VHCDAEALVSYLYDECGAEERRRIADHLDTCAACAEELAGLGGARRQLRNWTPPEAALGFRITQAEVPAAQVAPIPLARTTWWRRPTPVWGQAVAATLLFGLGLALGSQRSVPGTPAGRAERLGSVPAPYAAVATRTDLDRVESALRTEIARLRAGAAPASMTTSPPREDELLRQVRLLLRESEQRQQDSVAVRVAQMARDAEIQRRVDQATLQRSFMQIQGTTGEEVRQQRELLNYLVNVSQRGAGR